MPLNRRVGKANVSHEKWFYHLNRYVGHTIANKRQVWFAINVSFLFPRRRVAVVQRRVVVVKCRLAVVQRRVAVVQIMKFLIKGAVSHFTHAIFLYFLGILRISYRFSFIKNINCIIFTFYIQKATDVRQNHCHSSGYIPPRFLHSPCFKYIVYQINYFALIVA